MDKEVMVTRISDVPYKCIGDPDYIQGFVTAIDTEGKEYQVSVIINEGEPMPKIWDKIQVDISNPEESEGEYYPPKQEQEQDEKPVTKKQKLKLRVDALEKRVKELENLSPELCGELSAVQVSMMLAHNRDLLPHDYTLPTTTGKVTYVDWDGAQSYLSITTDRGNYHLIRDKKFPIKIEEGDKVQVHGTIYDVAPPDVYIGTWITLKKVETE